MRKILVVGLVYLTLITTFASKVQVLGSQWLIAEGQHSTDETFYLETKGGLAPDFFTTGVIFSPDEHFVAVAGVGMIYIYDTKTGQEVRRTPVDDNPFGAPSGYFGFSPSADRFYARRGPQILECPLREGQPCTLLSHALKDQFTSGPLAPAVVISSHGSTSKNQVEMGWKSPKGDIAVISNTAEDGGQVISLKFLSTNKEVVLASSISYIGGIDFFPGLIVTHGSSTHFIDFSQGKVQGVNGDVRVGGMRRVLASFEHNSPSATWNLAVQGGAGNLSHPGLRLNKRPRWFRISDDGNAIIYQMSDSDLSGYAHGQSVDLNCSLPSFSVVPVSDPSGSSVGAFCFRDAKNPSARGFDTVFVGWDLHSMEERVRIVANGFDRPTWPVPQPHE
jgi:hypothetical protein